MSLILVGGVLLLAVLGHGYFWIDGVNRLHAWAGPRVLIDYPTYVALGAFLVLPLLVVWDWWQLGSGAYDYLWLQSGWLTRYVQLGAFWGAAKLIFHRIALRQVDHPRTLLSWRQEPSAHAPQLSPLPVTGIYTQLLARLPGNQCLQLSTDFKRLAIPQLPANHIGLKIAHLSDLHMTGRIKQKWFEGVVDQVNQLEPDVIALTGDLVEVEACWPWLSETLGRLRARYGIYFILGNHDFFIEGDRTRQLLTEAGLICVSGRWIEAEWNGVAVQIAGNERPWFEGQLDQQETPALRADQHSFKLILAHTPDQFAWSCRQEAHLVLAGHTHGGQIRFPLLGAVACPSLYGTRYACGVFRSGETVMHVSRGISGETPLRWNCPPEIALLELERGESSEA